MTQITKNVVSGDVRDFTTTYAIANGDRNFTHSFSNDADWNVQLTWVGLDDVDATVTIQGSNEEDGNYDQLDGVLPYTLSSANGSHSIYKATFPFPYIRVALTQGSNSSGTVKMILNIKKSNHVR